MKKILIITLMLFSQIAMSKNLLWDGNPIDITTSVNQEIRLDFPETIVELDISKNLELNSEVLLTPEGKLFWTPNKTFDKERVIGVSVTGTLYILNLSVDDSTPTLDSHYVIIDPVVGNNHNTIVGQRNAVQESKTKTSAAPNPTPPGLPDFLQKNNEAPKTQANFPQMASFAISHYTGPKRMIPKLAAAKVSTSVIPKSWLRTDGNRIYTKMLSAWLIDDYYVTAIYARNLSNTAITFDPVAFRGRYVFSSTLSATLSPKDNLGDETIWVFISDVPFHKTLIK